MYEHEAFVRVLKILYVAIGLALLAAVFTKVEFAEVWSHAVLIGVGGMVLLIGLYGLAFLIDSFTWQMAMAGVPLDARWLWRAFKVRMVGEVFNNVMPAAGMGGEPVKAMLLNKHYGLGYREGTASIILGRTINMVSQLLFLAIGFAAVWASDLPGHFKGLAVAGLAGFVGATAIFFYAQRLRVASLTGSWLGRWQLLGRINDVLHHIRDMDERLIRFYTQNRARFAAAICCEVAPALISFSTSCDAMLVLLLRCVCQRFGRGGRATGHLPVLTGALSLGGACRLCM